MNNIINDKWEVDKITGTSNGKIIVWKCKKCGEKTWSILNFPIEKCGCVKCSNVH